MKGIGAGRFGSVFKVFWKSIHNDVACKKLTALLDIQHKTWEAFKHELHMQIRANSCENIIRILGISKGKFLIFDFNLYNASNYRLLLINGNFTDLNNEYVMVMEYANEGDLKSYLLKNFDKLDWNRKFGLALDITRGLHYLHKEDILHRDLVSIY